MKIIIFFLAAISINCTNAQKVNQVIVECRYMAYTDNGETPNYRILSSSDSLLKKDDEFFIKFKTGAIEVEFLNKSGDCSICYKYVFTGQLEKDKDDFYVLKVDFYELYKNKKCCRK